MQAAILGAENAAGIRHLADETGYIIDTHTGVASCVYKSMWQRPETRLRPSLRLPQASTKFSHSVMAAAPTGKEAEADEFASINALYKASGLATRAVEEIRNHRDPSNRECDAADMKRQWQRFWAYNSLSTSQKLLFVI